MKPVKIKILLLEKGLTVEQLAGEIGEGRVAVSQTINYLRRNDRIREKLAKYLKIPLKKLFDEGAEVGPAKPKQRSLAA